MAELQRIVPQIGSACPGGRLVVRGDCGFCREEWLAWCAAESVDYLLGGAKNERRKAEITKQRQQAQAQDQETGRAARLCKEFVQQTRERGSGARRVVAKAEPLDKGENPRFVVTSLSGEAWPAQAWQEEPYGARGDMENRIQEQRMLFRDRTSTHYLRSHPLRLYFSSIAYVLLPMLRRLGLAGTALAKAQCSPLRLKLLKIGALIRITVRKVWVSLAGGYPYAELFRQIHAQLGALPLQSCTAKALNLLVSPGKPQAKCAPAHPEKPDELFCQGKNPPSSTKQPGNNQSAATSRQILITLR